MKKITSILLILSLVFVFACCEGNEHNHSHNESEATSDENHENGTGDTAHSHNPSGPALETSDNIAEGIKNHYDAEEDKAYHELFFDKNTKAYENKKFTKKGVFTKIYDAYNETQRYYVWGWGDESETCCYQWEFVPSDAAELPPTGSLITVEGTMTHDEKALDKYWLTDTKLTVDEKAEGTKPDYDFTSMSPVLIRVQLTNMHQHPDTFKDKTVKIIGKSLSENTIGSHTEASEWSVHFTGSKDHLDAGLLILVEGTFNQGGENPVITSSSITAQS